jgi:hypothetical protein
MASRSTIAVAVEDVSGTASCYARLGLRVTGRTAARADVELPCGIHLLLFRSAPGREIAAELPRRRRRAAVLRRHRAVSQP